MFGFGRTARAPQDHNHERPPAQESEGGEQRPQRSPPGQAELDRQLGRRVYQCQKLVTELQIVECCLLWFKDELPPALLLQNAPGLLGLPQQPAPVFAPARAFRPVGSFSGVNQGGGGSFGFGCTVEPVIADPPPPAATNPAPPSVADLHDAKEYLQAANTRERFMRLWREQAYPARNIYVPRKVAHAKASLSIPQDPWKSFPEKEGTMNTIGPEHAYNAGGVAVVPGYQSSWNGSYAMNDWQRIVAYLEGKTDKLEQAIGACFR